MSKEALCTGLIFLRNSGPLKIRLLQCFVVLWIHNIDVICLTFLILCFREDSNAGMSRANSPNDDALFEGEDIEVIPAQLRNTEAIVISNIKKTFTAWRKPPIHAVKGINLRIYPNEITAILGN